MPASRNAPDGYHPAGGIVIEGNRRLAVWLNVLSVPWLVVCAAAHLALLAVLRPDGLSLSTDTGDAPSALLFVALLGGGAIAAAVLALVLHELAHGLAFWLFTRTRPVFGFKGWYAYAAAPGWYLTRAQFLAVGLAPLVLLPLPALPLLAYGHPLLVLPVLLGLVVNATGAIGDLYIAGRLLRLPRATVVEDHRDRITWHLPA